MTIIIEGMPRAWARPKKGRFGRAATVGYGSKRATKHLADMVMVMKVAKAAHAARETFPLEGAVSVSIDFDFSGSGETRVTVASSVLNSLSKRHVDLDNCIKLVFEALQHAGIVHDDAQIASVNARKLK